MILLSVLITTVPNRFPMCHRLWGDLLWQVDYQLPEKWRNTVEILSLCDNKRRSIGAKRQALLDCAQGEYIAYVDDDDAVSKDYLEAILGTIDASRPDLIVFPIRVTINGEQDGIVEPSVQYAPKDGEPLEEYRPPVTKRPPHELCVWRRSIAMRSRFPDVSVGEDFIWAKPLWPLVASEERIPKPLYHYRHMIAMREHEEEVK